MTEAEELLIDWKAVYGELFPGRDPELMRYEDSALALGVMLRREMRMYFERNRLHRLSRHDPKDPE